MISSKNAIILCNTLHCNTHVLHFLLKFIFFLVEKFKLYHLHFTGEIYHFSLTFYLHI